MVSKFVLLLTFFHYFSLSMEEGFKSERTMKRVAVLGGGVHGASILYHLAKAGGCIPILIERESIGAAASGKAGGFLAREWGSEPTVQLHQKSYDLMKELAQEIGLSSYREIPTLSVDATNPRNFGSGRKPSWLDKAVSVSPMSGATAQVTPLELTQKLVEAAIGNGAEVMINKVIGLAKSASTVDEPNGRIIGVQVQEGEGDVSTIPCDAVCLALGPWTAVACEDWLGIEFKMEGIKSTSIVFQGLEAIRSEPVALFCAEDDRFGTHLELYPRPNGDLYICGIGGSDYVSGDRLREGGDCAAPSLIDASPKRIAAAQSALATMSTMCESVSPSVTQACMRPCLSDGLPVMSRIPGYPDDNAYISCGHNCWGILWSPISGKCMSELILTGKSQCVDLSRFSLERAVRSTKARGTRGRKQGQEDVGEQW